MRPEFDYYPFEECLDMIKNHKYSTRYDEIFDIVWTCGAKRKERVYIGVTSCDDRLIRKLKLERFIGFIYYALIFIGVLLIFDAFRVY